MKRLTTILMALTISAGVMLACTSLSLANELSDSDCIKCHTQPPADIEAQGGAHKTAVTCMECHEGHPPSVRENIPTCDSCHSGKSHYELENCLSCHNNPHMPLVLQLAKDITDPCLTCHQEQGTLLQENKSFHTTMACTACHQEHAQIPLCVSCHEPHGEEMVQTDCAQCHQAHTPLVVVYNDDTPSQGCGSCHDEALSQLATSTTKHHSLSCAACHKEKHKMVPACQDCHGVPHSPGIMKKFPTCGECHSTAHNLNL